MKYNVMLMTEDKNLTSRFMKVFDRNRMTTNSLEKLSNPDMIVSGERGIIILDLSLPAKGIDRLIYYYNQNNKDKPIFILNDPHNAVIKSEALRNLSVYAYVKRPSTYREVKELKSDLDEMIDSDMEKKFDKITYLEQENVFACTFRNNEIFFLNRKDISDDDGTEIKNCVIDKDGYLFVVNLASGKKYEIVWDFVRAICDEKYEYHKSKQRAHVSSKVIGDKISKIRKLKKIKQEDLAKKSGILRANISRIEGGKHSPSLETLEKIADALKVPVFRLLTG